MITSMTGFASATHEAESATTSVTVKSVNHRFLDVQLRVPSTLAAAENALRTQIQQRLARGRVEVTVAVQTRRVTTPIVELDEAFAGRVAAAIERAREIGVVSGALASPAICCASRRRWRCARRRSRRPRTKRPS